ncbi:MAG: hypothetical protein KF799_08645 [Bdellovibrionales bacterium]|nr:hypothetical protein [Bdellovibrionales bacterium]
MAKLTIFVSATIVAIFIGTSAQAAPHGEAPSPSPAVEEIGESRPPGENMAITPVEQVNSVSQATAPRYYMARQALVFRGGLASDFPKLDFSDSVTGVSYLFPKFLSPQLEAGADLHENGRGHMYAGARWTYFQRSYFRPSAKLALDHFVDAKYGLGTLARIEDWFVRGGGSLEYTIWNPYSIRFDAEMLLSFEETKIVTTIGISRGW